MAIKKSDLYAKIWESCDELRGAMDPSQYKDYVLVLLFIKYVSDKYAGRKHAGVIVPPGASFSDMVALKNRPDIGDQINKKIIAPLAAANRLADMPDFNDDLKLGSGKEKVQKLSNLIAIFQDSELDFSNNRADGDDLLGDAYEYLMRNFATESGKSKGQFYTPAEVSQVNARLLGIVKSKVTAKTTIYDPTCGSGSLLLKVADEAGPDVSLYGQEKDATTSGLARMNMILHQRATAEIVQGNTLANPKFADKGQLKQFDYVVANPPFSDKRWSNGIDPENDDFDRFTSFGIPPNKQGDYAYLLHIVASLKSTGTGTCILPHGVLFRGNGEATIRENLVRKRYIAGIVGLPPNLFYGTGIPACIVVIDKRNADKREGIFMIDASAGFMKDGPKNRLRAQDIHKIVDVFNRRFEVPKYARMVPFAEIEKNGFNLNIPRYIDSQVSDDIQDVAAHLQGGIPIVDIDALDRYWKVCPNLRKALFKPNRTGYVDLAVGKFAVKATIQDHTEFKAFVAEMRTHFVAWRSKAVARLKSLTPGFHPKDLIKDLSEELLAHYIDNALMDPYAVYQHLMDYWAEVMQDDCYLIAVDGWKAETQRVIETNKKTGKTKDKGWICDLIPKEYVVSRFFSKEQDEIDSLTSLLDSAASRILELEEEHGIEGGALDLDAVNRAAVSVRLKEIANDKEARDDAAVLKSWLELNDEQSSLKKRLKDAEALLDARAYEKYSKLRARDIKSLVVEDKWVEAISSRINSEVDKVQQNIANRALELADRYETPLPAIQRRASELESRIDAHLAAMGFASR